ncbi:MAG: 30S ribosomal protein S13 [Candidatus Doudnabacteria bacterium RIFCSPHIGHO2_02_FULL_46_11]|uniref:Small ribosomal subunit protein uS13 n=1 Tax=Candidatus Doudnabacteria bacterium RIFCSPHIGHO2_02_FULL_46_11 TaxID=1817832 RepID=A0A1F5P881_9BACT|nr:MAG: 30S ribosomal protein S13 [Candidatus Doudnabacteria bacterium RIFCSPHIGHO2_02_FULL_46_11]
MARIAGVNLPASKRIEAALPYIYGIGWALSRKILKITGVDPNKRAGELDEQEVAKLREIIEKEYKVEGTLRQQILMDIKRLKEVGAYRGTRHVRGLPVRGQRTRTNSRTRRGNVRRTAGSGKRKVDLK